MSNNNLTEKHWGELFEAARQFFRENQYGQAEPLLQQLASADRGTPNQRAEVWHMIAVMFYDRGKFSKAIKFFKRALEISPAFTDASVGLSIILNDLGRYEEGRKVFLDAQAALAKKNVSEDDILKERLASKHDELGEMYLKHRQYEEALEQFKLALAIAPRKVELRLKVIDAMIGLGDLGRAFREIRSIVQENPGHAKARIKFGIMLYQAKRIADAVDQWETVLMRDPEHPEAKRLLDIARDHNGDLADLTTEL